MSYLIHGNYTAVFAGPLYAALMGNAIVKSLNPSVSIKASIHPLPLSYIELTVASNYNVNLVSNTFKFIIKIKLLNLFVIYFVTTSLNTLT